MISIEVFPYIIRYARTYYIKYYYNTYTIHLFSSLTFQIHIHIHIFPPLQPQNITCYFCYRPTIFLLFYLFTFLPLNAFYF